MKRFFITCSALALVTVLSLGAVSVFTNEGNKYIRFGSTARFYLGSPSTTLNWLDAAENSMMTLTDAGTTGNVVVTGTLSATGGISGDVTASKFVGSGSTTDAVDLATAEVAGTLPIANGGTSGTSAATACSALGFGTEDSPSLSGLTLSVTPLAIASGGTSGATAAAAASALGLGTEDSPVFTAANLGVDNTTYGVVNVYGAAATTGGSVVLFNAADDDDTYDKWAFRVYGGNFYPEAWQNAPGQWLTGKNAFLPLGGYETLGGIHVGAMTDAGTDNIIVDGTSTLTGEVYCGIADAGAYSLQGATVYTSGLASLNSANVATALNVGSTGSAADDNELCVGIADAGAYSLQGATLYTSGAGTIGTTLATGGAIVTTQNSTHEVLQMKRPLNTANAAQVVSTYMYNDANAYINYGFAGTAIEANGAGVESGYFIVYNRTAGTAAAEKFRVSSAGTGTFKGGLNVGSSGSAADDNEACIGIADAGAFSVQGASLYASGEVKSASANIGHAGDSADSGEIAVGTGDMGAYSVSCVSVYATGDVSALTFTDRASAYKGEDALTEILCVDHTSDDTFHQTLPEAVKRQVKTIKKEVPEGEAPILDPDTGKVTNAVEIEVTEAGWDLGETVSMLTAAVQQLEERNKALETRIAELEKKPK